MNRRPIYPVFLAALVWLPLVSHADSSSISSVVIEQLPSEKNEIIFAVGVLNEQANPLRLETDFREVVNYQLGDYDWEKQVEGMFLKSSYMILSGEKKFIRLFRHDLSKNPSPDAQKAIVRVEVRGVGEVVHEFELKKPGLFENLMGGIFGAKKEQALRQAQGEGQGAGDVGHGNELNVIASPVETKQSASNPATPSSVIPAQAGIQAPAIEPSTPPVTNETPINQTPSNPPPPQTEPEVQTPVEEPAPEEPSAPVINPPAQLPSDTTPPSAPTVNSLPQAVNAVSVLVSGTKEANSSIWINDVERVAVNNSTSWNFDMPLLEGTNLLRVESRDAAGNVSSAITVSVIRDTLAPSIQSTQISNITLTGATIQITSSEGVSAVLTYQAAGSPSPETLTQSVLSTQQTFTLSNLQAGTPYEYFVTIQDQVAALAVSATLQFTTQTQEQPFNEPVLIAPLEGILSQSKNLPWGHVSIPDSNGDGIEELALLRNTLNQADGTMTTELTVYYSPQESGGFVSRQNFGFLLPGMVANDFYFVKSVGDLNGDSQADLLLAHKENAALLLSRPAGGWSLTLLFTAASGVRFTAPDNATGLSYYLKGESGDFNNDAVEDLLVRDAASPDQYFMLLSNPSQSTWQSKAQAALISPVFGADYVPGLYDPSVSYELASYPDLFLDGDNIPELTFIYGSVNAPTASQVETRWFLSATSFADSQSSLARTFATRLRSGVRLGDLSALPAWYLSNDTEIIIYYLPSPANTISFNTSFRNTIPAVFQGQAPQMQAINDKNGDGISEIAVLLPQAIDSGTGQMNVIYIYYSHGDADLTDPANSEPWGYFDFLETPNAILSLPASQVDPARFGQIGFSHLALRQRSAPGGIKQDLALRTIKPGTQDTYIEVLWKEK